MVSSLGFGEAHMTERTIEADDGHVVRKCRLQAETTTKKKISSSSPQWGRKSNIVTTSVFCTQGQYIKITICKGPLTLIEAKLMGLATKDINIPCMHAEVRRLVCMALH